MFTAELRKPTGMVGVPEFHITSCNVARAIGGATTNNLSDFYGQRGMLKIAEFPPETLFIVWDEVRQLLHDSPPYDHLCY